MYKFCLTHKIFIFIFLPSTINAFTEIYMYRATSWSNSNIEFRIPSDYPTNVPIFSVQVLQLPDYTFQAAYEKANCNANILQNKRFHKRDLSRDYKKAKRRVKHSLMKPSSLISSNPITSSDNKHWREDNSVKNHFRTGNRFRLIKTNKNKNDLFKLIYDDQRSLLSLQFQRKLKHEDYVGGSDNLVEVAIGIKPDKDHDGCSKEKSKKPHKLIDVKLYITEPLSCKDYQNFCMIPKNGIYIRQWENRPRSPLLSLPSLNHTRCPRVERDIKIKINSTRAEGKLVFENDTFYNSGKLDRENVDSLIEFAVYCDVKINGSIKHHESEEGTMIVEDENDSPPIATRDRYIQWHYPGPESRDHNYKKQMDILQNLFVVDPDLEEMNSFEVELSGYNLKKILQVTLNGHSFDNPDVCKNETIKLPSPLVAKCYMAIPYFKFNDDAISSINRSSVDFSIKVRDKYLLSNKLSKGSKEVSYHVTMLLNGTYERSQNSIKRESFDANGRNTQMKSNITISKPPQKYARLVQIMAPRQAKTNATSGIKNFTISGNGSIYGIDVTPMRGTLYVLSPLKLQEALDANSVIEITVIAGEKFAKKFFISWSGESCALKGNKGKCGGHVYQETCESSCGKGSSSKCEWRPKIGKFYTLHYATCSPGLSFCPDGICDELEIKDPMNICPQDCAEASKIKGPIRQNNSSNIPRGITEGFGTCSCDEFCTCFPVVIDPVNPNTVEKKKKSSISEGGGTCGEGCQISLILGSFASIIVVCVLLIRRRKECNGKFKEDLASAAYNADYMDDYSSYASGPGHVEAHNRQVHSVHNANTILATRLHSTSNDDTTIMKSSKYFDPKWEYDRNLLMIQDKIGEGEFGKVSKATASNIGGVAGESTVAVKMLKSNSTKAELKDLVSEFELLKDVKHPNVIRLLGACTLPGGPLYVIIEYCKYGSLRSYLRKTRNFELEQRIGSTSAEDSYLDYKITPKDILGFAWQISKGMAYLTVIKLVHRDLAARNILLAENRICKISDFGLTRDVYEGDLYFKRSKSRVPVKWMAPESLSDQIYTIKSDIWGFGVLLWELVTLGSSPYPSVTPERLFSVLKDGYRMEKPDNCSDSLYQVMRSCWKENPDHRPTFEQLTQTLEIMINADVEYLDLSSLIATNWMYFGSDVPKEKFDPDNFKNTNNTEMLPPTFDKIETDKDSYLKVREDKQPPPVANPRIHAHNPSYAPNSNMGGLGSVQLQYSALMNRADEEEYACRIEEQETEFRLDWGSDSEKAAADSGYITEDNRKIHGIQNTVQTSNSNIFNGESKHKLTEPNHKLNEPSHKQRITSDADKRSPVVV